MLSRYPRTGELGICHQHGTELFKTKRHTVNNSRGDSGHRQLTLELLIKKLLIKSLHLDKGVEDICFPDRTNDLKFDRSRIKNFRLRFKHAAKEKLYAFIDKLMLKK